jgi:hypothetical protein
MVQGFGLCGSSRDYAAVDETDQPFQSPLWDTKFFVADALIFHAEDLGLNR